jgi:uncharacterized protein (TIGR02594 family)
MTAVATAKPVKRVKPAPAEQGYTESDDRYAFMRRDWERTHGKAEQRATVSTRRTARTSRSKARRAEPVAVQSSFSGFGSSNLVSEARKYLGTNPTGRRSLWCGAFMDMVLKRTGHQGGGNLARAYASYGTRVSGPQVGAIAVIRRKGGGHVGVISGIDPNGNPIIVSGNHNNTVAESVYPRSRIIAYVVPGG